VNLADILPLMIAEEQEDEEAGHPTSKNKGPLIATVSQTQHS
jgi:hypothetical protein